MRARLTAGVALVLFAIAAAPPSPAAQQPSAAERDTRGQPGAVSQSAPSETKSAPAPAPEAATDGSGLEWTRSSTGRKIPDPTGTRFFKPATSGGAGVKGF